MSRFAAQTVTLIFTALGPVYVKTYDGMLVGLAELAMMEEIEFEGVKVLNIDGERKYSERAFGRYLSSHKGKPMLLNEGAVVTIERLPRDKKGYQWQLFVSEKISVIDKLAA